MKEHREKCLICTLFLVAGLICLFVGWIVWIKSGDSFTTGLALLLMGISFFIRPLSVRDERQNVAGVSKPEHGIEGKQHAHKAA